MPFMRMMLGAEALGIADGPTEVHKVTIARQVLREHRAAEGEWPSQWLPGRVEAAKAKYAHLVELEVGNL
jgi:acyl-CoA dehydrogenase